MRNSIRSQLLWTLLGGVGILLSAAAAGVYLEILEEIGELFDIQLQQAAYTFQRLPNPAVLPTVPATAEDDDPLDQLVLEVRRPGNDIPVYHSRPHVVLPADAPAGFSTAVLEGREWRIYRVEFDDRNVEVGQPLAVRRAAANEIAVRLLAPLLVALLVAGVLIWFGVGRGLKPLEHTTRDVRRRSPVDLAPLAVDGLPGELTPLVASLNELMARLARALKMQKNFVSDAAHELLTPLAGLQLQVQLLDRVSDAAERASVRADLRAGVARAIHLARQLLTLARQDPERPLSDAVIDLGAVMDETVARCAVLARVRDISLEPVRAAPLPVRGDRHDLHILLENLVDNAVKYTPRGGRVAVSAARVDGRATLTVADSGRGVPEAELERLFDRFYRRPGEEAMGSGLGLAIAREIAVRHGATLTLENGGALGGLVAHCRFPEG